MSGAGTILPRRERHAGRRGQRAQRHRLLTLAGSCRSAGRWRRPVRVRCSSAIAGAASRATSCSATGPFCAPGRDRGQRQRGFQRLAVTRPSTLRAPLASRAAPAAARCSGPATAALPPRADRWPWPSTAAPACNGPQRLRPRGQRPGAQLAWKPTTWSISRTRSISPGPTARSMSTTIRPPRRPTTPRSAGRSATPARRRPDW